MKRRASGIAFALLSVFIPAAGICQDTSDWTEPFEPVQIADNLFYVGSAGLSAFLLTSDEGHVLIDAPLAENVPLLLRNIRTLGFDPRDIRLHVVTHAHFDHVAGLAELMAVTGGELVVSEGDSPFITEGRDFGFDSDGYPPAEVGRTLTHLEPVRLGDLELIPHVTPGHTPGCTSWSGTATIDGEPYRYVLVCSLSALDVYRLGGDDPTYTGQAVDFCRSVAHLESVEPDIFLSNHAQFFALADKAASRRSGDERAFVDRGEYRPYLEEAAEAIDRELERQGLGSCAALVGGESLSAPDGVGYPLACQARSTSASRCASSPARNSACRSGGRDWWYSSVASAVSASVRKVRPDATSRVRSKRAKPSYPSVGGRHTGISA